MKQNYYRLSKILKVDADYNILLGERSNGKSYAVKEFCIAEAWKHDRLFILVRRWDLEIKQTLVEDYFKDAPISVITDDECDGVSVYSGKIYLTKWNEETEKADKLKLIGYTRSISMEQHYTSGVYDQVQNIIFEEFISRDSYLANEPLRLMNFISTVARRRKIKVWMIGNTISRICPYFMEWQLVNIPKQKQGTIETYAFKTEETDENDEFITVTIAVEFCENSGRNSKMFFGASSEMIVSGAWQSKSVPHLEGRLMIDYSEVYDMYILVKGFKFRARYLQHNESGSMIWFVCPHTKPIPNDVRIVSDTLSLNILSTIGLQPLSIAESAAFDDMKRGRIVYSDNLTGADFQTCIQYITV